ncbi:MAG: thermonuclease family protein [candidate division Zixibacteria bacterium]|nr:thermonuclease family protein [candidate division Zixibacteria bacterium]MDD5426346.1 thermonuclease family protein [candidate division Zixibacteria bacterium]
MVRRYKSASGRHRLVNLIVVTVLVVVILVFRLVEEIGPDKSPGERFVIVRVIDGDTVDLKGGDRLRLLAIDTPEKDEPFYEQARFFLESLTVGKTARVEYESRRRDRYGRLLGYVYIDTLFVNKAILENGLGYLYLFKDNDPHSPQVQQLLAAQRQALTGKRALWSLSYEPENYYVAARDSYRFHRPGCRSVAAIKPGREIRFKNREEALSEGYSPCRNCKP